MLNQVLLVVGKKNQMSLDYTINVDADKKSFKGF